MDTGDPYAAPILPGGRPPYTFDEKLLRILRSANERGILIAAICLAPIFPAHAGLLETGKLTTSASETALRELGRPDPFRWKNFAGRLSHKARAGSSE